MPAGGYPAEPKVESTWQLVELRCTALTATSASDFMTLALPAIARETSPTTTFLYAVDPRLSDPLFLHHDLALYPVGSEQGSTGLLGLAGVEGMLDLPGAFREALLRALADATRRLFERSDAEHQLSRLKAYLSVSPMLFQEMGLHGLLEAMPRCCIEAVAAEAGTILFAKKRRASLPFTSRGQGVSTMKRNTWIYVFVVFALLLPASLSTPAHAQNVWYVKPLGTGLVNCLTWDDACDLQAAVALAGAGDELWIAAGVHRPIFWADRTVTYQLNDGVQWFGGFPPEGGTWAQRDWEINPTILSGDLLGDDGSDFENRSDNAFHVVSASLVGNSTVLDGLVITGGHADTAADPPFIDHSGGGGLLNVNGSPTLRNIKFIENYALQNGGGMYSHGVSYPSLTGVAFIGNTGESGGGLASRFNSGLELTDVEFETNSTHSDGSGGGLYLEGGLFTLTGVVFTGNYNSSLGRGGAMAMSGGTATLTNVSFVENRTDPTSRGGAVWLDTGKFNATGCTFQDNVSGAGGALYNDNAYVTLGDCSFANNEAAMQGGGIYNYSTGSVLLQDCTLIHNVATGGGGVFTTGELTLVNSTLGANCAFDNGGAILAASGAGTHLHNVTVTGNDADMDKDGTGEGGGLYYFNSAPQVFNSIIAGNRDSSPGGVWYPDCFIDSSPGGASVTYNLMGDNTGCAGPGEFEPGVNGNIAGTGATPLDPLLGQLAENGGPTQTHALLAGSPARDAGDPSGCGDQEGKPLSEDQRGMGRPRDGDGDGVGQCDMGAFEAGLGNDSWPQALPLDISEHPYEATAYDYVETAGQSRWYKFQVYPGSRLTVELIPANANLDLTLFQDIQAVHDRLTTPADERDLAQLMAEFASDAFSPDAYAPDAFSSDAYAPMAYSPMAYSPMAYSPMAYSPMAYSPMAYSPMAYSPMAYSPMAYSPMAYSPMAYSPMAYSPDEMAADPAYSLAQMVSLVGVSAFDGLATESITVNTWDHSDYFYARVRGRNGAFAITDPFVLSVTQDVGICKDVDLLTRASPPGVLPDYAETLILTDWERMKLDAAELAALQTAVYGFADLVDGVVVDVGLDPIVDAANAEADALPECAFAKNQVARLIKDIVSAYRAAKPELQYAVIVGNDEVVPFFRHPDRALLANEKNYNPPVLNTTASHASLALGYVLSQDFYGSSLDLPLNNTILPISDLPLGRLVETPEDIMGQLAAYAAAYDDTTGEAVVHPGSALVTGYDFLSDAAHEVRMELEDWLGVSADLLISPADMSPLHEDAWTAADLRGQLLAPHDVIFLAGHFSADATLAADFETRLPALEVATSAVDLQNALIFSAGCHSGYNIVNEHGIPFVTGEPDWAGAFARKGAAFVGGTGYQYGDTDFIEYSERLYLDFARRLRCGAQPVPIGQALVEAKQEYLAGTAKMRGIHEKALLEATLYGLPMLKLSALSGGSCPGPEPSIVSGTTAYPSTTPPSPGQVLGLEYADIPLSFSLTESTVTLNSVDPDQPGTISASYFQGPDGVVTNPVEPVLPLDRHNASVAGKALRGIGFRGGSYTDLVDRIPLTGAATTELRGVHAPFLTDTFFPIQPWSANYFGALAGASGGTQLVLTPAQFVSTGSNMWTGTWRRFDGLDLRLFYSGNTQTFLNGATPALAAPPDVPRVLSTLQGDEVRFAATVLGDPAAGIQEVWVTYTTCDPGGVCDGTWQTLDPPMVRNPADSTLWEGTLVLGGIPAGDIRYIVQAVNGVGLVTMADNMGEYFRVGIDPSDPPAGADPASPPESTSLELLAPPGSGAYSTEVALSARLSTAGSVPVIDQKVKFALGSQQRWATTAADGVATVSIPLLGAPGSHEVLATFPGNSSYLPAFDTDQLAIGQQGTQMSVHTDWLTAQYSDRALRTLLTDVDDRPLRARTVLYVFDTDAGPQAASAITNHLSEAYLSPVPVPEGSYPFAVHFGDIVNLPGGTVDMTDINYTSTTASGVLLVAPEKATVVYTGDTTAEGGKDFSLAATVNQEDDGAPGDITLAMVEYVVFDASNIEVARVQDPAGPDGTSGTPISGLSPGEYQVAVAVVGGYFSSGGTPDLGPIFAPADPVEVNTEVSFSASFSDPDALDTHTAIWVWGDGQGCDTETPDPEGACTLTEPSGSSGSVTGSHTYTEAGVYTVGLQIMDDAGNMAESVLEFVVVYDTSEGFVTGGGWIMSPPGACQFEACISSTTGRASFGFVSRYKKGAKVPTGQTQFQFVAGNLSFHSTAYDWLVVAHHKAMYKGTGTINGSGSYGFLLSAIDAALTPSTDVDLFRIKIWDFESGAGIYDNQVACSDSAEDADPCTQIGGGGIVIHAGKKE